MANLSVALTMARASLNDVGITLWDDTALLPHVTEAHIELQTMLELNGIAVTSKESAAVTVNAGVTTIANPADIIEPIELKEKAPTEPTSAFVSMTRQAFIPEADQEDTLRYWAWVGEQILLLGATAQRSVEIYYVKSISIPAAGGSPIGFIWGESYLGPRIAALALGRVGNWTAHDKLTERANKNIDTIVRMNVKGGQSLPTRKRPFMWQFKRSRFF